MLATGLGVLELTGDGDAVPFVVHVAESRAHSSGRCCAARGCSGGGGQVGGERRQRVRLRDRDHPEGTTHLPVAPLSHLHRLTAGRCVHRNENDEEVCRESEWGEVGEGMGDAEIALSFATRISRTLARWAARGKKAREREEKEEGGRTAPNARLLS
jgi:hypothetical protein